MPGAAGDGHLRPACPRRAAMVQVLAVGPQRRIVHDDRYGVFCQPDVELDAARAKLGCKQEGRERVLRSESARSAMCPDKGSVAT